MRHPGGLDRAATLPNEGSEALERMGSPTQERPRSNASLPHRIDQCRLRHQLCDFRTAVDGMRVRMASELRRAQQAKGAVGGVVRQLCRLR